VRARHERQAVTIAHRRHGRCEHLAEHVPAPRLVEVEVTGPSPACEQLADNAIVHARVLAHIERREVEAEDIEPAQRIAELLLGDRGESGCAHCPVENREVGAVARGFRVAVLGMVQRTAEPRLHVPELLAPRLVHGARAGVRGDLGKPLAVRFEGLQQLVDRAGTRAQRRHRQ